MTINPSFISNLAYKNYVSQKELNISGKKLHTPKRDTTNIKTPSFSYYDSVVKNGHLYPEYPIKVSFMKVYEPPKKPARSVLLQNIQERTSKIPNKMLPRWE